jgi:hypothetical protein
MIKRSPFFSTIALASVFTLGCNGSANNPDYIAGITEGSPFGKIEDQDIEALMKFANENGVDLKKEFERAYKKDSDGFAAALKLSLKFNSLDRNARAYGQVIWSSLLNLGESWGVEKYADVLDAQEAEVQQRIRDILYYPMIHIPKLMSERRSQEEEARSVYPALFPKDYEFGRNDPVFR